MPLKLSDPNLLRFRCHIGGEWVGGDAPGKPVVNPATGETIGEVPMLGAEETRRAIDAAARAFDLWRRKTAKERSAVLRRWFDLQMQHSDDLAAILTAEQGKPLAEARGEIIYSGAYMEFYAEEAKRIYGDLVPSPSATSRITVMAQPIGVVAAITPWNFPSAMLARKMAPALAAGCTIVCKPAIQTPLSAFALAELADRAGFPPGAVNVITGKASDIGAEMTANPIVRKFTFTGSTEVGKLLMKQCAGTVKKVSLELGGNAPFIVFDDADISAAVTGAMASKYRNSGQTCVCANRFLVQDSVYDAFAEKLTAEVAALKVGNGTDEGVVQGPLIDMAAVEKVEELVNDAVGKGASAVTGGKRHALGRTFFEPTVLTDVSAGMALLQEEIFGPVAPLIRFSTEEEAVAMANDTIYGLASYFYSRDMARCWRVAEALEYGMVGVNEGIISSEAAPFGGVKESGLGREGGKWGIDEYMELKYTLMGGVGSN